MSTISNQKCKKTIYNTGNTLILDKFLQSILLYEIKHSSIISSVVFCIVGY